MQPYETRLHSYIAYYYFHSADSEDFEYSFSYFPNYKNALTIYRKAEVNINGCDTEIRSAQKDPTVIYSFNTKDQSNVSIKGEFSKIGIVFQPLGINHFLPKPLNHYFDGGFQRFGGFKDEFLTCCKAVFETQEIMEKVLVLDEFFIKHFCGFGQKKLLSAIDIILKTKGNVTIQELSDQLRVNRKTLLRLFKQHMQCSVKEYCKMVKFRSAIETFVEENPSLTELAYKAFYYDQSHFINQFKELANQSPKEILPHLKEISKFGFLIKEEE